jgi:hypothetical protein
MRESSSQAVTGHSGELGLRRDRQVLDAPDLFVETPGVTVEQR